MPGKSHWSTYTTLSESADKEFTGLFAAVVATFLVQSCTLLVPDPGDQSMAILSDILNAIQDHDKARNETKLPFGSSTVFSPPAYAVRVNSIWSLSLVLSLFSAFMATLVQLWVRRYLNAMYYGPGSARDRALLHASLLGGVDQFAMRYSVDVVVLSLHAAVALFVYGLAIFLEAANEQVAWTVKAFAMVFLSVYTVFTVVAIIFPTSPYATPLSEPLRYPLAVVALILHSLFFGVISFLDHYLELILKRTTPLSALLVLPEAFDIGLDRRSRLMSTLRRPSKRRSLVFMQGLARAFQKDVDIQAFFAHMSNHPDPVLAGDVQEACQIMLQANVHHELAWFITSSPSTSSRERMTAEDFRVLAKMSARLIEHCKMSDHALLPLFKAWEILVHDQDVEVALVALCQLAEARLRFLRYPSPADAPSAAHIDAWWRHIDSHGHSGALDHMTDHIHIQGYLFQPAKLNLPVSVSSPSSSGSESGHPHISRHLGTLALVSFVRSALSVVARGASSDRPVSDGSLVACKHTLDALSKAVLSDPPAKGSLSHYQFAMQMRTLYPRAVSRTTEAGRSMPTMMLADELRAYHRWKELRLVLQHISDTLRTRIERPRQDTSTGEHPLQFTETRALRERFAPGPELEATIIEQHVDEARYQARMQVKWPHASTMNH
ncbi:hypothetical protein PENSPDRAFT_698305 [Peniophora sp. CONT]|nr:hypothetical protein PENSPDRAFT_698305 [Peniophora sp. CONT]